MRRWYVPVFRQLLEWAVLNTGVILRQRPKGKLEWSAINLKVELATQLSHLGSEISEEETGDELSADEADGRSRLQRHVCHVPVMKKKRVVCRAHVQRKMTRYFCSTCNKGLCLGLCWKLYHTKVNYLFEDAACTGKRIHLQPID